MNLPQDKHGEAVYSDALSRQLKGKREVKTPVGLIDVLTATEVIEVKHVSGWKGAIGQVIAYARYYPNHKKRIHLFGNNSFNKKLLVEAVCSELDIVVSWASQLIRPAHGFAELKKVQVPKKSKRQIRLSTEHPLDNVVYYSVGTRVLWRGHPGRIIGLHVKAYPYEVGYNVRLDDPKHSFNRDVRNSGYRELAMEATGKPGVDGYSIPVPDKPTEF